MEVKSQEQKTFTYTLTISSSELDEFLEQTGGLVTGRTMPKLDTLYYKLKSARDRDLRA